MPAAKSPEGEDRARYRPWRVAFALSALALALGFGWQAFTPLFEIYGAPQHFAARGGEFTANFTGRLAPGAYSAEYRLGNGSWRSIEHQSPRQPWPGFTLELPASQLRHGANRLELRVRGLFGREERRALRFNYDPAPVNLPLQVDWQATSVLDVQDGHWEVLPQSRVRPVPGHEGFDRILAVTGAFAGGRRVETDVVFRRSRTGREWSLGLLERGWGFGIFPLWGGNPEDEDVRPRRGWRFSALWYFSRTGAVGCEFSDKVGAADPRWVSEYRNLRLEPDVKYQLVVEAWPETSGEGVHVAFKQRCKWWRADEAEPEGWMVVSDDVGVALPTGPYAVALFSLRSEIEFGSVRVLPLPPPI